MLHDDFCSSVVDEPIEAFIQLLSNRRITTDNIQQVTMCSCWDILKDPPYTFVPRCVKGITWHP